MHNGYEGKQRAIQWEMGRKGFNLRFINCAYSFLCTNNPLFRIFKRIIVKFKSSGIPPRLCGNKSPPLNKEQEKFNRRGFLQQAAAVAGLTALVSASKKAFADSSERYNLSGVVTDTLSGAGVSGLEVKLAVPGVAQPYSIKTGADGRYTFDINTGIEEVLSPEQVSEAQAVAATTLVEEESRGSSIM